MWILFIIFIALAVLLILISCLCERTNEEAFVGGCGIGLFIAAIITMVFNISTSDDITAIEVYRGNTTLQITYQDSIPIDSVVVYKDK